MKILLLNDNPVVNKLVTLSAQKTSDELESVDSIDDIKEGGEYDLLVVDDTLYDDEVIEKIKDKVNFERSLYICSRDSEEVDGFTSTLQKPFLPTELVEMFVVLGKNTDEVTLNNYDNDEIDLGDDDDLGDFDLDLPLEELEEDEELEEGILDEDDVQEVQNLLDDNEDDLVDVDESGELEFDLDSEFELDLEDDLE
ncbi:MAG: hypothetical protein U9N02_07685, partial [Campylobacterota bacterium]|nr:hypothetical protein [Campylobacterota bacterium]